MLSSTAAAIFDAHLPAWGEVRKNKMFNDPKAAWSKKLRKEKMVGLDKRRNEKLSIPEKIVFLETLANRLNS